MSRKEDDHISRFYTSPLYSGTTPEVEKAPSAGNIASLARPAATMNSDYLAKGAGVAADAANAFVNQAVEYNDYTLDLKRSRMSNAIKTSAVADINRRKALPDGHPDALFDANGVFREDVYQSIKQGYDEQFNGLDEGYIGAKATLGAKASVAAERQGLALTLDAQMGSIIPQRAANVADMSIDTCVLNNDFAGARQIIATCPAFSDKEKANKTAKVNNSERIYTARYGTPQDARNRNDFDKYAGADAPEDDGQKDGAGTEDNGKPLPPLPASVLEDKEGGPQIPAPPSTAQDPQVKRKKK